MLYLHILFQSKNFAPVADFIMLKRLTIVVVTLIFGTDVQIYMFHVRYTVIFFWEKNIYKSKST